MFTHPWIWLNEPQHASAVEALTSVIGTLAAMAAGVFAGRAYYATKSQVDIAEKAIKVSQDQLAFERERFKADLAAEKARRITDYQVQVAEEDATRPRFNIIVQRTNSAFHVQVGNGGAIAAKDLVIKHLNPIGFEHTQTLLHDGHRTQFQIPYVLGSEGTDPIFDFSFSTKYGTRWALRQSSHDNKEQIIDVCRPYRPPDLDV